MKASDDGVIELLSAPCLFKGHGLLMVLCVFSIACEADAFPLIYAIRACRLRSPDIRHLHGCKQTLKWKCSAGLLSDERCWNALHTLHER